MTCAPGTRTPSSGSAAPAPLTPTARCPTRCGAAPSTSRPRPTSRFWPVPADPMQGDLMDTAVQRLIATQEIADLLARYTFGLDTKDWAQVRGCFTDAPVFIHPGGRVDGADGIIDRARGALDALDGSQHLLGNVVVDVLPDGATARAISYFQAQHVRAGTPG